jgi:hypothetical protein
MDAPGNGFAQPVRFNIRIRTTVGRATQQYLDRPGRWSTVSCSTAFRIRSAGTSDLVEVYDDLVDRGLDVTAIRRAPATRGVGRDT